MKDRLFIAVIFLLIFSSCARKAVFTSNVSPSEIGDMVVFEPISYISIINKGDKMEFSDSLSKMSKHLWLDVMEQNHYRLPTLYFYEGNDDFTKADFQDEVRILFEEVAPMAQFYSIPIPHTIKSYLDQSESRFGMLTVTSGFTRRRGNLTGQILKGVGIGIITLGMVVPMPVAAHSNVYTMILDNERDEIIYYRESKMNESQPLKHKTLNRQLDFLYKNYFW